MAFFDVANPLCYECHKEILPGGKATCARPNGTYLLHQNKCFNAFMMANPRFKAGNESAQKAIKYQQEYKAKISDLCTKLTIITSLFVLVFGLVLKV